jgi:hypothetical protein
MDASLIASWVPNGVMAAVTVLVLRYQVGQILDSIKSIRAELKQIATEHGEAISSIRERLAVLEAPARRKR